MPTLSPGTITPQAPAVIPAISDASTPLPAHPQRRGTPVAPARRSQQAKAKDAAKQTAGKLPVRKYGDLLSHLSTLDRQAITFGSQKISKLAEPTPVQRRAFELLGAPIPLTLK